MLPKFFVFRFRKLEGFFPEVVHALVGLADKLTAGLSLYLTTLPSEGDVPVCNREPYVLVRQTFASPCEASPPSHAPSSNSLTVPWLFIANKV